MGETLFIAHRIPFPPDRGDKIRSHHFLKALAELGPIHVATFGETGTDFAAEPLLAEIATSHCLVRRPASLPLAGLRALASDRPVSLAAFDSPSLRSWIARLIVRRPIDTIFVFSGQMGQYVPHDFPGRVVVDLCDVDSAKFDAYAAERGLARGWIDGREGRLLAAEERRLAARADATLLISDAEADLFRRRLGASGATVLTVGNGIDTGFFDPRTVPPHAGLAAVRGADIVFTGQMDYPPNISAVRRTARHLMPSIRAAFPDARFHIVGRAPVAAVRGLDGLAGTRVWGEVRDVRPFLAAADLVIAPLDIARGVQNKVLEAMAMARPVLLTPEAATGIGGLDGVHYLSRADDGALVEGAQALLSDPSQAAVMGMAARQFVEDHKSWAAALSPLPAVMSAKHGVRDAA